MSIRLRAIVTLAASVLLATFTGCESTGGSSGGSVGVYGSYYGGYYPGYPGYWYDDDDAIVVRPPEDRPERPDRASDDTPIAIAGQQALGDPATIADDVAAGLQTHAEGKVSRPLTPTRTLLAGRL